MRIMLFQINNQRPPLTDVNVRRAISYAFDYDGFNKEFLGGSVERNPVPIPNNLWGIPKDVKGYGYDIDKAKAELAKREGEGRPAADRRLSHGLQPDRAGGDRDGERPPQGSASRPAHEPAVAGHGPPHEEAGDVAGSRRLLDQHLLRRPEQLDRRNVPLGAVGHVQGVEFYKDAKADELLDTALRSTDRKCARRRTRTPRASSWTRRRGCGSTTPVLRAVGQDARGIRFSPIGNGRRCAGCTTRSDEGGARPMIFRMARVESDKSIEDSTSLARRGDRARRKERVRENGCSIRCTS